MLQCHLFDKRLESFKISINLCFKSSYEKAAKYNGQLSKPSTLKPERKKVFEIYRRGGYSVLDSWYNRKMIPVRIGRKVRSSVPAPVKRMIKAAVRRGKVE